jgi:hypothetical protein
MMAIYSCHHVPDDQLPDGAQANESLFAATGGVHRFGLGSSLENKLARAARRYGIGWSAEIIRYSVAHELALNDQPPVPTESFTHFFVKLVFAAPASFLSAADESQVACASFWHFFMKLVKAAPASFLSVAWLWQVEVCAAAAVAVRQSKAVMASLFI